MNAQDPVFQLYHQKLRYLIRNPVFQEDVSRGRDVFGTDLVSNDGRIWRLAHNIDAEYEAFLRKWGLAWLTEILFVRSWLPLDPTTVLEWEQKLMADLQESPAWRYCYFRPPVMCADIATEVGGWPFGIDGMADLYYDPYCPERIFLEETKRAARLQRKRWGIELAKSRNHLNKTNFYIAVYDAVLNGMTFSDVARRARKQKSTIQSVWIAVRDRICTGSIGLVREESVAAESFAIHRRYCQKCHAAQTADEFCGWMRRYTDKGYKAQREFVCEYNVLISLADTSTYSTV